MILPLGVGMSDQDQSAETRLPTFDEIEAERAREEISVARMCREAGLIEATYYRARAGKTRSSRETRKKLAEALVKIRQEDAVNMGTRAA